MVDAVQQNRPHTIDGTKVETKRATPREEKGESGKSVKKVFVGGLKDDIEDKDLEEYFGEYGNVTSAEQMVDKATGRKRGFGFVEFDDYDPVDKLLQQPRHQIKGHRVDIKKALGKNELNQMGGGGGGFGGGRQAPWGGNQGYGGGFGGGFGGGYGGGDGYGGGANNWGGNNPWQGGGGGWGDQGGNDWSGGNSGGGGYMTSGGGWGGGYGSGNSGMSGGAGGAMRNSMMGGGGNRSAPYSVGGRGGGAGRGRGGGAGAGGGRF